MSRASGKQPEHETIYMRLKKMVLFGEFVPGQPVTILGLSDALGAGVTPVREAIRRLTAEGALCVLKNRRVEVPEMTAHRLKQIDLVRMAVEPTLAAMAAQHITKQQIYDLEHHDRDVDRAIEYGDARQYLSANYRFHFALYAIADAPVLQRAADSLWLQMGPALRVGCGRFGTAQMSDKHREAIGALCKGDAAKVKKAIEEDISQGMDFVRHTLPADGN